MTGSWPPSDAPPPRDLAGRTCAVTGPTSGIGLEIARGLAARGATLVLIGRDVARTRAVAAECAALSGATADAVVADLASLAAVRAAAADVARAHPRLHGLILNAGVWSTRRADSIDGVELTWATNVLGHHVLAAGLFDALRAGAAAAGGARLITVASTYAGDLDLDDPEFRRRRWGGIAAYRQSKLALRLWTWEAARRLAGTGVTANACHPGGIYTGIYRSPGGVIGAVIRLHARLTKGTPVQGADTPVWLASAPALEGVTGRFWADRREIACPWRDPALLSRLWELLERQAARPGAVAAPA